MSLDNLDGSKYLDALLRLPEMWSAAVSPDGQWVAWTWAGLAPTMEVYLAHTAGNQPPVRLTVSDQNTWLVSWLADSSGVIVAQDENGNERAQLFRVLITQPAVMEALTQPQPSYYIRGGQLHPNGHWLVYSANVDESGAEIESAWIYRHDLVTGERVPLACPHRATSFSPQLNTQGTHVLYTRKDLHPSGSQLWLVGIDGADDHEIVNVGAQYKVTGVWCPDGQSILVHADNRTHFRIGIWSLDASQTRWLIDDPARNIEQIAFPRSSSHALIFDVQHTRPRASLLDVRTGLEQKWPDDPQATLIPVAPVGDGVWVAQRYSSRQIRDLVRIDNKGGIQSLTRVWEQTDLTPDDLSAAEDFRWRSDDGLAIQGWLYRARGEARGTIIYVHGGPTWHYEDWVDAQIQFFVTQGFHVLAPNYRGSTGFSRTYCEAIKEDGWGGREQDDIRAGIEALIAAGVAVPGRIGITGTSYGGYSAWCAITRLPTRLIAAAAPICGMTDLVIDYETTRPDLRAYSAEMMGGTPSEVPERYHLRSPIHFVSHIRGHLLIVQGEQDPNVTPENVTAVRTALDAVDIAYELLTFADEGHGIERRPNQKTLLLRLADFFTQAFQQP